MAYTLTLIPVIPTWSDRPEHAFSCGSYVNAGYGLRGSLPEAELASMPVPVHFQTHLALGEDGQTYFGDTPLDGLGDPLHMTTAGALRSISNRGPLILEAMLPWRRAAFAWLDELPGDMRVALYWS